MSAIQTSGSGKLDRSGAVVLDAAGGGRVEIGAVPAGQVWAVTRMTVACTGTNNPMPVCKVYDGFEAPQNLIDATYTGGQDVSDFPTPHVLQQDQGLLFVWSGGVAGTRATARLVGTQQSA
jgi:hypothetical protein